MIALGLLKAVSRLSCAGLWIIAIFGTWHVAIALGVYLWGLV